MSFRVKLLLVFTLTVATSVGLVAWGVSFSTQKAFEQLNEQRTNAIVAQFRREFQQRGTEISARVRAIADSEATLRMAIDLSRPEADASVYVNDAHSLADSSHSIFWISPPATARSFPPPNTPRALATNTIGSQAPKTGTLRARF